MRRRYKLVFSMVFLLAFTIGNAQSDSTARDTIQVGSKDEKPKSKYFEGIITYEIMDLNPNPNIISDEDYYNSMPKSNIRFMKMYIKENQFKKEFQDHVEIYYPSKGMYYVNYPTDDSSQMLPAGVSEELVTKVEKGNQIEKVYDRICEEMIVSNKWGKTYYYFDPSYLTTNKGYWTKFNIDNSGSFLSKSGSLPLKIIVNSMLGNVSYTVINVQEKALKNTDFEPSKTPMQ